MDFSLDENIAVGYKSKSQKIRVTSEEWVTRNIYCPCCGNLHIRSIRDLIIEAYLLLQGSKDNMTGDLSVCDGTAFAKGLQIHNQLNKKS